MAEKQLRRLKKRIICRMVDSYSEQYTYSTELREASDGVLCISRTPMQMHDMAMVAGGGGGGGGGPTPLGLMM